MGRGNRKAKNKTSKDLAYSWDTYLGDENDGDSYTCKSDVEPRHVFIFSVRYMCKMWWVLNVWVDSYVSEYVCVLINMEYSNMTAI